MGKKDVEKSNKTNAETWGIEDLVFSGGVASDYNSDDVSEIKEWEEDLISFDKGEDSCDLIKDEIIHEEDLISGRDFKGYRKPKRILTEDMGPKFIYRSKNNSIDEDKVFEPSDELFQSKDPYKRKFLSFVCECSANDIEKYMKAICCYSNNVRGKNLYTKVVGSGCPYLYLLFVSLDVPFDSPFVDCFSETLKAAIK